MKTLNKTTQIIILLATALFMASCSSESLEAPQLQGNESSSYKVNPDGSFVEGKGALGEQSDAMAAPMKSDQSIAEIAIANGFDELVAALTYVDSAEGTSLVDLFLNGTDQYTVFAPTDAAFEDLYDALGSNVNEITDISSELVLDVLLYHVVEGRRASNSVVPKKNSRMMETLLGSSFSVNPDLSIDAIGNSANITAADISASNGIIHVIDAVILPVQ